jgi:putative tricarboxylic transport membrane protein
VNIAFIPVFIWMLRMPFTILAPMIFVLSIVGGYARRATCTTSG